MKITLHITFKHSAFMIPNVETVGLTLAYVIEKIMYELNIDITIRSRKVPKLQGVIPLYEEAINIDNDDDLKMIMNMYTDINHQLVKLKFFMERSGFSEDDQESEQFTLNEGGMLNLEFDVNPNTFEDESDDSDNLSNYSSSDNDNFEGPSDMDEESNATVERFSELMMENYFKQTDGYIDGFKVGNTFDDVSHFRKVIKEFSIQEDFPLKRIKNEKNRVTVTCGRKGCKWRMHASPLAIDQVTYQIKSYIPDHTCDPFGEGNKDASAEWIAEKMKHEFESNPFTDINTLAMNLKKRHGVSVHSSKLYRARKRAMEMISGDHRESYTMIPNYIAALRKKDKNILIGLKCDGLDVTNPLSKCIFERMFVCFPAQRDGFKYGCRPFVGIDGCFLKGPYGGQLLVATALDANNGIFPLAFMFAESESSWGYFLNCLQTYLDDPRCLTFMSDKQKGILKAVKSIFPTSSNRYCGRHRCKNFRDVFPGPKLSFLFWRAVRAANVTDFNLIMDEIKQLDQKAWEWLLKDEAKHWSLHAFDSHVKSDHVTNNMTESFNGWITKHRQLPILTLMEQMRRKCMKRFKSRYETGASWESELPPKVREQLCLSRKAGRHIQGVSNGDEFEVDDGRTYLVNLNDKTCQCGVWQLSGIPCKHAMACIHNKQADPFAYVDPYFTKDAYLKTYMGKIPTLPDKIHWPEVSHPQILPPIKVRGKDKHGKLKQTNKGRPALKRRREAHEPVGKLRRSTVIHCRKCKEMNHNFRTCPKRPKNMGKDKRRKTKSGESSSQVEATMNFDQNQSNS